MTTPKKKTTWVMTFFPGGARPLLPKVRFQHVQHPERYTACRWLYQVKSPQLFGPAQQLRRNPGGGILKTLKSEGGHFKRG